VKNRIILKLFQLTVCLIIDGVPLSVPQRIVDNQLSLFKA